MTRALFQGERVERDFPSHFHGPRSGPLEVRAFIVKTFQLQ